MATALGTYFLDTVEYYGIDEIRYCYVDESFHAFGDTWAAEHAEARKDDFNDVDTRLGELVIKVIPEVFFDEQPRLEEDAEPEPNVDGKWVVYVDAGPEDDYFDVDPEDDYFDVDPEDDYYDVDPTANNLVFKKI